MGVQCIYCNEIKSVIEKFGIKIMTVNTDFRDYNCVINFQALKPQINFFNTYETQNQKFL